MACQRPVFVSGVIWTSSTRKMDPGMAKRVRTRSWMMGSRVNGDEVGARVMEAGFGGSIV